MKSDEKLKTCSPEEVNEMNKQLIINCWEAKQEYQFREYHWNSGFYGLPHFRNSRAAREIY